MSKTDRRIRRNRNRKSIAVVNNTEEKKLSIFAKAKQLACTTGNKIKSGAIFIGSKTKDGALTVGNGIKVGACTTGRFFKERFSATKDALSLLLDVIRNYKEIEAECHVIAKMMSLNSDKLDAVERLADLRNKMAHQVEIIDQAIALLKEQDKKVEAPNAVTA